MFETAPGKILYCHAIEQPLFLEMENTLSSIHFHKGLPSEELIEEYSHSPNCNIIVLDDLMDSVVSNAEMEKLFTLGAHHRRLIIIYINQNLYCQGSKARTICLNTHFLVLMKNPRGLSSLQCLSRQVFPSNGKFMLQAYNDCMKVSYGYLLVDLSPTSKEETRLRSMIFPDEDTGLSNQIKASSHSGND
ncbi:MAG: hypothetical protein N0E59_23450 [Candidatus Thiodiazotropha taylori]|nr:hypothetical protein [Candidatus Thiodiazotropha taylori]MCW4286077.1 hypothetical protein [Candidatus Thiodiazotropha taylori]